MPKSAPHCLHIKLKATGLKKMRQQLNALSLLSKPPANPWQAMINFYQISRVWGWRRAWRNHRLNTLTKKYGSQ